MLIRRRVTAATPCQMTAFVTLAKLWNSWDAGFSVRPMSHPFSWTRAPSFTDPAMSFRSGVLLRNDAAHNGWPGAPGEDPGPRGGWLGAQQSGRGERRHPLAGQTRARVA